MQKLKLRNPGLRQCAGENGDDARRVPQGHSIPIDSAEPLVVAQDDSVLTRALEGAVLQRLPIPRFDIQS